MLKLNKEEFFSPNGGFPGQSETFVFGEREIFKKIKIEATLEEVRQDLYSFHFLGHRRLIFCLSENNWYTNERKVFKHTLWIGENFFCKKIAISLVND